MTQPTKGIHRRQVLAGAGVAAAVAATGGIATAAQAADSPASGWDHECDVLCIGSGAAAGTAAVTALAAGARVMMIEKMPILGGTTAKSGGVTWIFNHFIFREQGIDDKKDDALRYTVRYGYPRQYNPESPTLGLDENRYRVVEAFYDHGSAAVDHLRELDAVQFKQFRLFQVDKPAPDYADHLPENKVPTGRALEPATGSGSTQGGGSLASQMHAYLKAKAVPILTRTRVTRVIKDASGRVIGAEAVQGDKVIRIKASKGVVFGTGGYSHNAALCDVHQPAVYGSCSTPGSTGDFIPIAQEAGAMMGNMGLGWRTQVVLGEALKTRGIGLGAFVLPGDSMILVNKYGKRVVNEKRDYNDRTQAHFTYDPAHEEYPNHLMFMLFDERSIDAFGGAFPFPANKGEQPHLIEGQTWDEVFGKIDAQLAGWTGRTGGARLAPEFAANAKQSVASFNAYAKKGVDPEFGRGKYLYDREWHLLFSARRAGTAQPANPYPNNTMHPFAAKGPYYALILGPGTLDTAGGPQINANAQVLAAGGQPIPGLYAAGNCIAAPTGQAYLGAGGTIGPAVTFGYIAAKHAVKA
ncbi:FAD-binding protein [Novosphingobium sp. MMS21-SN21R]|uniref:FAD-dependent oxidoreductase n=1 Tax=Novosphingobium sp. MMS21-SN21R TaxID=2969298 RepID=UPI002885DE7C|nr:FAD-binding protein [Novosphingobium sp. MMS21-SN21R]MDT0510052.1 FAD-binding protein [Novosphingobium sp. MMS21-SN21R]